MYENQKIVTPASVSIIPEDIAEDKRRRKQLGNELEAIAQYNLQNGTRFYNMDQVRAHQEMLKDNALNEKMRNQSTNVLSNVALGNYIAEGGDALAGMYLNAGDTERAAQRQKEQDIRRGTTQAITIASLPFAGMYASDLGAYGLLGGSAKWAGGTVGSILGSELLSKAGRGIDQLVSNNGKYTGHWGENIGGLAGGILGWNPGSKLLYSGVKNMVPVASRIAGGIEKIPEVFIGDEMKMDILRDAIKRGFRPNSHKWNVASVANQISSAEKSALPSAEKLALPQGNSLPSIESLITPSTESTITSSIPQNEIKLLGYDKSRNRDWLRFINRWLRTRKSTGDIEPRVDLNMDPATAQKTVGDIVNRIQQQYILANPEAKAYPLSGNMYEWPIIADRQNTPLATQYRGLTGRNISADLDSEIRRNGNASFYREMQRITTADPQMRIDPSINSANRLLRRIGYKYRIPIPRTISESVRSMAMANAVKNTSTPALYSPGGWTRIVNAGNDMNRAMRRSIRNSAFRRAGAEARSDARIETELDRQLRFPEMENWRNVPRVQNMVRQGYIPQYADYTPNQLPTPTTPTVEQIQAWAAERGVDLNNLDGNIADFTPEQLENAVRDDLPILMDAINGNRATPISITKSVIEPVKETLKSGYTVYRYPGYMLKSLMPGNPLEKQIGKNGLVNVNNIRAIINKAGNLDQHVVNKVLTEKFLGRNSIDYNEFRKAIQDELITYNWSPDTRWANIGLNHIGYSGGKAFTFSSPRIPLGSNAHYDNNTLGHSRFFISPDEKDILYVAESQSDWAQKDPVERVQRRLQNDIHYRDLLANQLKENKAYGEPITEQEAKRILDEISEADKRISADKNLLSLKEQGGPHIKYLRDNYPYRHIQENLRYAAKEGLKRMRYPTGKTAGTIEGWPKEKIYVTEEGDIVPEHLAFDYIDSNTLLAKQQEKDRLEDLIRRSNHPISITDVLNGVYDKEPEIIEIEIGNWEQGADFCFNVGENEEANIFLNEADKLEEAFWTRFGRKPRRNLGIDIQTEINDIDEVIRNIKLNPSKVLKPGYRIEERFLGDFNPIFRRYADFPKQYGKLFKGSQVRNVTDSKGNTWYEVDVPEDILHRELPYKNGGIIKSIKK